MDSISSAAREEFDTMVWERVAESKWGSYVSDIERRAIIEAQSLAGKPGKALEIGCEGGRWSLMLSQSGWDMTCVDVDPQSLNICQRKVPSARCVLARPDDESIDCDTHSVKLMLCIEVAPVIQSAWFLREANRVLAKDGVLVGVFWNKMSWRGLAVWTSSFLTGNSKYNPYKLQWTSWKRNLGHHGFTLLHEQGFCWAPLRRASNSSFVHAFVKLEKLLRLNQLASFSPWVVFIARKTAG